MKLARYAVDGTVAYGVLEEGGIVRRLVGSPFEPLKPSPTSHSVNEVRLLAPVDAPRIIGVGLNYVSHIRECNLSTPTFPMLFMKHPSAVVGPGEPIVYPKQGQKVEYEGELAVIIGRHARRVSEDQALEYVLGY